MIDGKKPATVAKLAAQVVAFLAAAETSVQAIRPGYLPKWWVGTIQVRFAPCRGRVFLECSRF